MGMSRARMIVLQGATEGDEAAVDGPLGLCQRGAGVEGLLGVEEAAGVRVRGLIPECALERVDVEPVDGDVMVEGGA
jgi:hypothetical protein